MSDDEEVKFAVVRVKGQQKAVGLLNILLSNGYPDVSFVSNLDHLGFKAETLEEGSSSKVTSSSAAPVAPTTASVVSTTSDRPRPSTPPESSTALSDSKDQEQIKKNEAPFNLSPQPPNGSAASIEDPKPETSAPENTALKTPSPDRQTTTPSGPSGQQSLDQQPTFATPQQLPSSRKLHQQQLPPQPQVQQQKLHEQQQPGSSNRAPATLIPEATPNSLTSLANLAQHPYRLPVRAFQIKPRDSAESRSSMRSVDAHIAAKRTQQLEPSSSSSPNARSSQKRNQQQQPPSQWLQKPQKVFDTGTKSMDEKPIIFDPNKFTRARELAEEESRDTSYYRRDTTISAGASTSAASVVGSPTIPTSMPSTSNSSLANQHNQSSKNAPPYFSSPQEQQQRLILVRRSVEPRPDLQGQSSSRIRYSTPGANMANHPQCFMTTGMPPNNSGLSQPMHGHHRLAHPMTGSPNLAPVPQLTPAQTKILSQALNYTLGQLNPELKEACARNGITESQVVYFMSSRQHSMQANAGASTSATVKEEKGDDSDDVEVLKVVPRKKRKNED